MRSTLQYIIDQAILLGLEQHELLLLNSLELEVVDKQEKLDLPVIAESKDNTAIAKAEDNMATTTQVEDNMATTTTESEDKTATTEEEDRSFLEEFVNLQVPTSFQALFEL